MMRLGISSLLLVVAFGCSRAAEAPAPAAVPVAQPAQPAPAPVAVAAAPGDAPLPAPDEVPGFLRGPAQRAPEPQAAVDGDAALPTAATADPETTRDPSLAELMKGVSVGDHEDGESWAFIGGGDEAAAEGAAPPAAPTGEEGAAVEAEPAPATEKAVPTDGEPEVATDDCEPIRRALARQKDYLHRVAAERDRYGYIESTSDVGALQLLESLRRCESNPDDPDCKSPKVEVDISELEVPSHQIEREPSELNAEGKAPDEIPHDRITLELLHRLKACESKKVVQPLLQR